MASEESTKLNLQGASPSTSLTVPTESDRKEKTREKASSRASSPTALPTQFILKTKTQMGRINSLKALRSQLPTHSHSTSIEELKLIKAQVDELHSVFGNEHEYFESAWPARCLDHESFQNEVAAQETQLVWDIRIQLNRLREDVEAIASSRPSVSSSPAPRAGKLPEIALPTFSGIYTEWPGYSELFSSLKINDRQLSEIDRLHYLRSSLIGEPSRQINTYPLTGSSFQPCWEYLSKKYSNKTVLIEEQLDKLLNLSPITARSATTLNNLVASINEIDKSIKALGAAEDIYNCLLVHQTTNCLDKTTREAWETSVGSSSEYPRYEQLAAFIEDKTTALERLEAADQLKDSKKAQASSSSSSRSPAHKGTAHLSSQQKPKTQAQPSPYRYPCDLCKEDHYIVTCSKFRELSVPERRRVITDGKLCRNCCGRHKLEVCKSAQRCKTCSAQHHTMLHLQNVKAPAQPSTTTTTQPTPHTDETSTATKH